MVILMTLGVMLGSGLAELALVLGIRQVKNEHTKNGVLTAFGILASVLIAVALFPQYWEIYKLKAVIGISLILIGIDMLGGVFNDLSLVFKEEFDIIAACQYSVVVVLDGVIVLAAWYFKIKDWLAQRRPSPDKSDLALEEQQGFPGESAEGTIESGSETPRPTVAESNEVNVEEKTTDAVVLAETSSK